jgi:hypothetical protein
MKAVMASRWYFSQKRFKCRLKIDEPQSGWYRNVIFKKFALVLCHFVSYNKGISTKLLPSKVHQQCASFTQNFIGFLEIEHKM